jgi:hypothetical protein
VREGRAGVEEVRREADARSDEQCRRDHEEWERRRRLSDETLAMLKHRAEEALATDGVERMRLGYAVLVKLTVDALLERESMWMDVKDHGERARALLRTPALARLQ